MGVVVSGITWCQGCLMRVGHQWIGWESLSDTSGPTTTDNWHLTCWCNLWCLKVRLWGHNDHVIWITSTAVPSSFLLPDSQQVGNQTFGVHWLKQWWDAAAIRVYSMGAGRGDSWYTLAKLHSSASLGLRPTFICSAGQLVLLLSHCIHHASAHGQHWRPRWTFDKAAHHDSAQMYASHMTGAAPATRPALAGAESLSRKSVAPRCVFILTTDPSTFCFRLDWSGCGRGLAATPSLSPLIFLLFKAGQMPSACFLKLRRSKISEHKKVHQSPRQRSLVSRFLFLSFSS